MNTTPESQHGRVSANIAAVEGVGARPVHPTISQPLRDFFQSPENFKNLFDRSPIGIFQIVEGRLGSANRALTRMFGYPSPDDLERSPEWAKFLDEAVRRQATQAAGNESPAGEPQEIECFRKDGSAFYGEVTLRRIRAADGESVSLEGFVEEVSVRRMLEEQLRDTQREAAIGQLAGSVAHDFNNILSAILLQLSWLKENGTLKPEGKEVLREIESEVARATTLTRQLLSFTLRKAGRRALLDLNQVVAGLMETLKQLMGEDIAIRFQACAETPWLCADAGMLEHGLLNLCINARLTMPEGGQIALATSVVEWGTGTSPANPAGRCGKFVCLTISDTGGGMDENLLKRVAHSPSNADAPRSRTETVLAAVCESIQQHQGWLTMERRSDRGNSLEIYLPAASEVPHSPNQTGAAQAARGGTETILLVEDDQALRRGAALWLRKLGYAVLEAANSLEALSLWEKHRDRVDLLFSDMLIPDALSGLELVKRCLAEKCSLKVILSSGYDARAETGWFAGCEVTFLPKPFGASSLSKVIRDCLDGIQSTAHSASQPV